MERIYRKGEWATNTIKRLTNDNDIRVVYHDIIERTVGDDANQVNFPYDRYSAPDGIGRPEKLQVIGQWLCAETRLNSATLATTAFQNLVATSSLDDLYAHANARVHETGFSTRLPKIEGDETLIKTFSDGYSIVEITRPEAVRNEYCQSGINGGVGDGVSNLVLRDRDNASVAALMVVDNTISMIGQKDKLVPFHITETYLLDLIKQRAYKLQEPTSIDYAVQISDGRIVDVRDIPDGSTIDGSFWMHKDTGRVISKLPDDLTINGNFGIFNATYLQSSPKNLVVYGDAGFVNCPAMKTIKSGLKVTGYMHLETCDNLTTIEDGVEFNGVQFSGELKDLNAKPFQANRIVVDNYEVKNVTRDENGLVTIPRNFVTAAVEARKRKEIAQLPGLVTRVVVDELKSRIRNGVRSVKKSLEKDDSNSGPKI